MGTRGRRERQPSTWVGGTHLPRSAGHPFDERLNRVLDEVGFDAFVEEQSATFYADGISRPSLAPGRYVRMLLIGYVEGLDSERAMAWRAADSQSRREFLDVPLQDAPPVSRQTVRPPSYQSQIENPGLELWKVVGDEQPGEELSAECQAINIFYVHRGEVRRVLADLRPRRELRRKPG